DISWCLPSWCEKGRDQIGRLVPFARFARQLLASRRGERIELRAAIVLGLTPFRFDGSLLLELEECGVERTVIEGKPILARLLDPASDAVAVERSEDIEGLENHQGQRALLHVQFLRHVPSPRGVNRYLPRRTALGLYGFPI